MSRRFVFLIALIALAVLGTAASPWTLPGGGLSAELTQHVKDKYGLDLTVRGRSTFAVLPIPRVKFENVTLRFPNEALKAEGGTLRGELRVLPLLFGRIELSDFDLSETRITGSLQKIQAVDWPKVVRNGASETHARRLVINKSSLRWTDLKNANLNQLNVVIRWTDASEPLTVAGSAEWRDEPVVLEQASVFPDLLASDRISPFTLSLSSPSVRLTAEGEAQLGDTPRITGESTVKAGSVRDFTRWSGLDLPFGSLLRAVSVNGDFSMDRRRLSWPAVSLTLGSDKLEGRHGRALRYGAAGHHRHARSRHAQPLRSVRALLPGPHILRRVERGEHRPRAGDRQRSRPAPLGGERQSGPAQPRRHGGQRAGPAGPDRGLHRARGFL